MEINENSNEEYQEIANKSKNIPITVIPNDIIKEIVEKECSTHLFRSDWKDFASEIGLDNSVRLNLIEISAQQQNKLPLYVALYSDDNVNGTFGTVIEALLRLKRFDILRQIKDSVLDFLKRHEEKQLPTVSIKNTSHASEKNILINDIQSFVQNSCSIAEQLQKITTINCSKSPRIHFPTKFIPISVFIPHADEDVHVARELAKRLRDRNIKVTLLSEIQHQIPIDCCTILNTWVRKVDFVIPLISLTYVQYIKPSENNLKCFDALYNRFLHCCTQIDFLNNDCLNYRVRPVSIDLNVFQLRSLRQELLFSFIFTLWDEVERLVKVLCDTKPCLPSLRA